MVNHRINGIEKAPVGVQKRAVAQNERTETAYVRNASRIMYLYIEKFEVASEAPVSRFGDDIIGASPAESLCARGHATLGGGSISIIGAPSTRSRDLSIGFNAFDEEISQQRLALARRYGTKARYTHVTLGYIHHQVQAGNDGWFIECELAIDTLRAIVSAVSSGTLRAMTIGLALQEVYSDDWSRPTALTDWFLKAASKGHSKGAPQMAHGDMTRLSFDMTSIDLHRPSARDPQQDDFQDTSPSTDSTATEHSYLGSA
jgi:hypothetical protein